MKDMTDIVMKEVKLVIRSIIISHKHPPSIGTLCKDFLETEGRKIPHRQLGYSNLLDFLRSLKDTVVVLPDYTLKPVISAEQQHIVALVSKQKNSSKRTKRTPIYQRRSLNTQAPSSRRRSVHHRYQSRTQTRARYSGTKSHSTRPKDNNRGEHTSHWHSKESRRHYPPDDRAKANSPRLGGDSSKKSRRTSEEESSTRSKRTVLPEQETLTTDDVPSCPTFQSHVILFVQPEYLSERTYTDFESVDECMEAVCRIYEQHLKEQSPDAATITYDINSLFLFIDSLADLSCLVYQSRTYTYAPQNKDWIKNKIYALLKKAATSSTQHTTPP